MATRLEVSLITISVVYSFWCTAPAFGNFLFFSQQGSILTITKALFDIYAHSSKNKITACRLPFIAVVFLIKKKRETIFLKPEPISMDMYLSHVLRCCYESLHSVKFAMYFIHQNTS